MESGSTVTIPAHALVDKNGKEVEGMVRFEYREFHTPKEIFFSGIPMEYEVNDEKCFFESAGMLEINAYNDEEKLFIKEGEEISFSMSTDNTNEGVMLYELNPKTKKWKEVSKAEVVTAVKNTNPRKIWGPVYRTESKKVPKKSSFYVEIKSFEIGKNPLTNKREKFITFNLDIFSHHMSQLKKATKEEKLAAKTFSKASFEVMGYNRRMFKNLMMELGGSSTAKNWGRIPGGTDIFISDPQSPDQITLTFKNEKKEVNLQAKIKFNRNLSPRLMKKYFDQIASFNINEFAGRYEDKYEYVQVIDHYDSLVVSNFVSQSYVQREFTSRNFGILNCDQPLKLPTGMVADAAFYIGDEKINPGSVTLVDFQKNCLFSYYSDAFNKFKFNPDSKNFVFTLLQDGHVAFILPDEFADIQTNGRMKIPMHLVPIEELEKVMEELFPTKTQHDFQL
jgi:hypothetical protein